MRVLASSADILSRNVAAASFDAISNAVNTQLERPRFNLLGCHHRHERGVRRHLSRN